MLFLIRNKRRKSIKKYFLFYKKRKKKCPKTSYRYFAMTDNLLKWSVAIGQARKEAFDIRHLYFNVHNVTKNKKTKEKTIQKNKEEPRWI